MNLKHSLLAFTVLFSLATPAADLSTTVSGVSDYRFRGVSQTKGDPTAQLSIDMEFDNGIYVGIWGSKVDFDDDADYEVDYYLGYAADINDEFSFDVNLTYYAYPGYGDVDAEYLEFIGSATYDNFTFQYAFTNDNFNSDEHGHYVALDYSKVIVDKFRNFEDITLNLHAGRSFGDYWHEIEDAYIDTSVGISATIFTVDISLSYIWNDVDDGFKVSKDAFRNDTAWVFTISRTFKIQSYDF